MVKEDGNIVDAKSVLLGLIVLLLLMEIQMMSILI